MHVDIRVRLCSPAISELAFPTLPQCNVLMVGVGPRREKARWAMNEKKSVTKKCKEKVKRK